MTVVCERHHYLYKCLPPRLAQCRLGHDAPLHTQGRDGGRRVCRDSGSRALLLPDGALRPTRLLILPVSGGTLRAPCVCTRSVSLDE